MAIGSDGPVLVPILGDQPTRDLASLRGRTKDDTVVLMVEVWDEATYVRHHKQKIALIFSAMRHFAAELRDAGWTVDYVELDELGLLDPRDLCRRAERSYRDGKAPLNSVEGFIRQILGWHGACPFNPLYWHFMERHRDRLEKNHRVGRIYANWDRMGEDRRREYLESAEAFLDTLLPTGSGWARAD